MTIWRANFSLIQYLLPFKAERSLTVGVDRGKTRAAGLGAIFALGLIALPAHAGFEWTPPEDRQESPVFQNEAPAPVEKQALDPSQSKSETSDDQRSTQMGGGGSRKAESQNQNGPVNLVPGSVEKQSIQSQNIQSQNTRSKEKVSSVNGQAVQESDPELGESSPSSPEMVSKEDLKFETIQGFGNDVPLALTLRQVVPEIFSFAFEGVSPGVITSWSGGRPWDKILSDVLREIGAQALINNTRIVISSKNDLSDSADRVMVQSAPAILKPGEKKVSRAADSRTGQHSPSRLMRFDEQSRLVKQSDKKRPVSGSQQGQIWTAAPGERLSDILRDWTMRSGMNLFWNVESDYMLEEALQVEGDINKAAKKLFEKTSSGDFEYKIYPNLPDGPPVMLVRSAG